VLVFVRVHADDDISACKDDAGHAEPVKLIETPSHSFGWMLRGTAR
jgi:hypothetical protein